MNPRTRTIAFTLEGILAVQSASPALAQSAATGANTDPQPVASAPVASPSPASQTSSGPTSNESRQSAPYAQRADARHNGIATGIQQIKEAAKTRDLAGDALQQPQGAAAAWLQPITGTRSAQPARAAIAPVRQGRSLSVLIRTDIFCGRRQEVASMVALSSASSTKPLGSVMGQAKLNSDLRDAAAVQAQSKARPLIITFSGIDGSGKSTNIANLTAWLRSEGLRVREVTFWDNVVVLPRMREKLTRRLFCGAAGAGTPEMPLQRRDKNLHPWYVSLARCGFFLLDAIRLRWLVKQMLSAGPDVVIFDRYLYDQLAILPMQQRAARIYARLLCKLVPRPDISYLLDADPEAAFIRKPEYPLDFLKQYRRSYFLMSELVGKITLIPALPLNETGRRVADEFKRVSICPPGNVRDLNRARAFSNRIKIFFLLIGCLSNRAPVSAPTVLAYNISRSNSIEQSLAHRNCPAKEIYG